MVKITGIKEVKRSLVELRRSIQDPEVSVVVGYTQAYAIWVHETQKNYTVGGWHYLVNAARDLASEITSDIRKGVKKGLLQRFANPLEIALLRAGERIQAESQDKYVPVETSALKASAFTALQKDVDAVAAETRAKSDVVYNKNERASQQKLGGP